MKKLSIIFLLFIMGATGVFAIGEQYVRNYNKLADAVNQRIKYAVEFEFEDISVFQQLPPDNPQYPLIDDPENGIFYRAFCYPEYMGIELYNARIEVAASHYGKGFIPKKYPWNSVTQSDLETIRSTVVSLAKTVYILSDSPQIPNAGIQTDNTWDYFLNAIHGNPEFGTIMSGIGNGRDKFTKVPAKYVNENQNIYAEGFVNVPILWIHFKELGQVIERLKWLKKSAFWVDTYSRFSGTGSHPLGIYYSSNESLSYVWPDEPHAICKSLGDAKKYWGASVWSGTENSSPFWDVHYGWGRSSGSGGGDVWAPGTFVGRISSRAKLPINPFIEKTGDFYSISKYTTTDNEPVKRTIEGFPVSLAGPDVYTDWVNLLDEVPDDVPDEPIPWQMHGSWNYWLNPIYVYAVKDPINPDLKDPAKGDSPEDGLILNGCTCISCIMKFDYWLKLFELSGEVNFPLGISDGNLTGLKVKAYIAAHMGEDLREDMYSLETCVYSEMSGTDLDENESPLTWDFALVLRPTGPEVVFALSGVEKSCPDNGLPYRMEKFTPEGNPVYYEVYFPTHEGKNTHRFVSNPGNYAYVSQCRQKKGVEEELVVDCLGVGQWPGLSTNYSSGPFSKIINVVSPVYTSYPFYRDWYGGLFYAERVDYWNRLSNTLVQRLVGIIGFPQISLSSYTFDGGGNPLLGSKKTVTFDLDAKTVTELDYTINGGVADTPAQTITFTEGFTKEGLRINTKITRAGQEESKSDTIYGKCPWGEEICEVVTEAGTPSEKKTVYAYYENPAEAGYKKIKSVSSNDGSWTRYEYDSVGREVRVITPFGNGKLNADASLSRVTEYAYSTNPLDFSPHTIVQKVLGTEISRSYNVYQANQTFSVRAASPGAAWDATGNLIQTTESYPDGDFKGRTRKTTNPDGTVSVYNYALNDGILTTTVESGSGSGYTVTDGTRTVTVTDVGGNISTSTTYDIASGIKTAETTYTRDAFGRPTRVDYMDGTYTETQYGCCGPEYEKDREGVVTLTGYDTLNRVTFTTRAGITTLYTYDVLGNVTSTTRKGTDNSECTSSSTYNAAGDLISTTDPMGNTTTYSLTTSDHRRTTTLPDGSQSIVKSNADGSTAENYGSAVHGTKFEYGIENGQLYTKSYPSAIPSQWTKSYTDFLGRNYMTLFADNSQSVTYYDDSGRPFKQVSPAGKITLTEYNAKGEVAKSAIDLNGNGVIDDGTDRVTAYANIVTGNVRRQTVTQNGVVVSVSDTALNGFSSSQTSFGRTMSSSTVLNGNGSKTVTTTNPDGSTVTQTYLNGFLTSSVHSVLGTTTYTYDPHGRLSSQQSTVNGQQRTIAYAYNDNDQLIQTTENGSRVTGFTYDSMGRRTKVNMPDGRAVNYRFAATGEMISVSGADTYPVNYSFDALGRMKTLTDGNGSTTTWNYESQRGFMTSKIYANGQGTSYAYNADGQPVTRTWARGAATTYAYNAAGELTGIDYSDSTPDVTFTRDRFGRATNIADGTGSRTVAFNDDSTISSESIPHIANHGVNYGYDNLGRRSQMQLTTNNDPLTTVSYSYDGMSRLSSVSGGSSLVATASYSRISGSSLLSSTSISNGSTNVMTVNRSYDSLNRLTGISSVPSVAYSYTYNTSDKRSKAALADGSYWVYKYDQYGQVTGAHKFNSAGVAIPGQQFDYAFDTIGNRKVEKRNGNLSEYASNSLNQYLHRTVPGKVDITGSADEAAQVRIQKVSDSSIFKPDRAGKYFSKSFNLENPVNPVAETFNIFAVKYDSTQQKDIVAQLTENIFLPKTPELYTYDPDGNLLSDGRFTYAWDGENRLIGIESSSGNLPEASRVKLAFSYDYMSRRVSKSVYHWDSNTNAYSLLPVASYKFVYDGWNLIAKFNASNALQESYLWGEDISGSLQGAGGVGGLLAVSGSSGTYIPAYDGNGNIVSYVDSTGAKVAEYEYDAFGRTIVKAGVKADDFSYRFSTKWLDGETGDYYYGYRYYNADTGRWLGRDPIQEKGGMNLYGFIGNDSINKIDRLGLMKFSEIKSLVEGLDREFSKYKCCTCSPKQMLNTSVRVDMASTINGPTVTSTLTILKFGCVKDVIDIFWWDCFSAQDEAGWLLKIWTFDFPKGWWQEYGWNHGTTTKTMSVTGGTDVQTDASHWAWSAGVIYTYCGKDGYQHAAWFSSNDGPVFTWNGTGWTK